MSDHANKTNIRVGQTYRLKVSIEDAELPEGTIVLVVAKPLDP